MEVAIGLAFVQFVLALYKHILMYHFLEDVFPVSLTAILYGISYLLFKHASLRYNLYTIIIFSIQ